MRIVPHRNISAPKRLSGHLHELEYIEVLKRFTHPPILKQATNIFPDIFPIGTSCSSVMKAGLAKFAWKVRSPSHIFFGNQIISDLLDNTHSREEVIGYFGSGIIHDLIYFKGRSLLSFEEQDIVKNIG